MALSRKISEIQGQMHRSYGGVKKYLDGNVFTFSTRPSISSIMSPVTASPTIIMPGAGAATINKTLPSVVNTPMIIEPAILPELMENVGNMSAAESIANNMGVDLPRNSRKKPAYNTDMNPDEYHEYMEDYYNKSRKKAKKRAGWAMLGLLGGTGLTVASEALWQWFNSHVMKYRSNNGWFERLR